MKEYVKYGDFKSVKEIYERSVEYKISMLARLYAKHFPVEKGVKNVCFGSVEYNKFLNMFFEMPYVKILFY
jgi:hypothetical protein